MNFKRILAIALVIVIIGMTPIFADGINTGEEMQMIGLGAEDKSASN